MSLSTNQMAKIMLFTSCKGGVGKSTVCANLAMTLANMGRRVLMIDCDFGSRCLDLVAGLSDLAVYDIADAVLGRISPEKAVIVDKRNKNLSFVAAPYSFDPSMTLFAFKRTISYYAKSGKYDYVFIDTPGGAGEPLLYAAEAADWAFIITSPTRASVRAADKTAAFLYARGVRDMRLIVNRVAGKKIRQVKENIIRIIDEASVRLIGAVPYDPEIIVAGDEGRLTDSMHSKIVTQAFENIAKRTEGEQVPLFHGIKKLKELK